MYETILVEKKARIAMVTFNRPEKLNCITPQLDNELTEVFDDLANDKDIRVVILTGAGRAFCTGFDVPTMLSTPKIFNMDNLLKIVAFDKPFIAAVNGYALAQGFQIALACDIIVASEKAIFGSIGASIGEMCNYAVFALPRVIGRNKAGEMLFTCEHVSGEEAFRIGLATRVVPHEKLIDTAWEIAEKIKDKAPLVLKYTKQALRRNEFSGESLDWVNNISEMLHTTDDFKEAFKAILEKREAVFEGK